MQLGMIGLGRMGGNIVRRLMRGGHKCVVFDQNPAPGSELAKEGASPARDLADFVKQLDEPRAVWVMLPAGAPTEQTIEQLGMMLEAGDTIIDGGNTFYQHDVRRAARLKTKNIHYVDCGTSGGVWGLERGYCMMIGGDKEVVDRLDPIFATLAPGAGNIPPTPGRNETKDHAAQGYVHCGPVGSGHFVKMVHNGIEYGMMQAYAEGFDILRHANDDSVPAERRYDLKLPDIAEVWRRGSVIQSWLLDLTAAALNQHPDLSNYSGYVEDSGEGRWTINAAIEEAVAADVLAAALFARFRSRDKESFANKMLSAMRHGFGGHLEPKKPE
ncbi:MAG TPA: decarboxylating 6-phosphogluconate dehydrogenase [Rhizomicrobium sp.]|nr:decarboxylating 6-phosphogluconate dehydrogenase [Rhizomicrobium sp.]